MKKNFNESVVEFLKLEETMIRGKIKKCLSDNNFSMYKNLIQAYEKVVELIKKYDWQLMYSKYRTEDDDGNLVQQVAVWEQNGDESVRNHKVWNVMENNVQTIHLPQLTKVTSHISKQEDYCIVSYVDNIVTMHRIGYGCTALKINKNTTIDNIISSIEKYTNKDKQVSIYIDTRSEIEFKLSYHLESKGYDTKRVHTSIIEPENYV